ncbi:unnamed protein product, partial [Hymenolepis diminuta]
MHHLQTPIALHILRAFQAELKFENGEFAYGNSHNQRLRTMRNFINCLEIVNPDTILECFSHFRGMRARRERLDIFIQAAEGEEVGAHLMVLSVSFPVFRQHLRGSDVVHHRLLRFSSHVVNAAVEYAYTGIENISPEAALRLYLLAHNLQNKALVDACTK